MIARSASFLLLLCSIMPAFAQQRLQEREEEFLRTPPLVGAQLPDVEVFTSDGKPFQTQSLRGHYTVLTFGCLTCPPSIWNIAGLEAVHQDYAPKGVRFYFIFKSLAHPELAGNYIQPFTLDERMALVRQAQKQLGTRIPWLVDAMDNRLKRALGDRPNSQFLIDPQGNVVRKRAWSNPEKVRSDLEELVGPVERVTRVEDLKLSLGAAIDAAAPRGTLTRIPRPQMQPLVIEPVIAPDGPPFYAKLRAEGDAELIRTGAGRLYLGFHLDPLHGACWNNLNKPVHFTIEKADGVTLESWEQSAAPSTAASDSDPREFLLKAEAWPETTPLTLSVTYYACVKEACFAVRQRYILHRRRDIDGGGARGIGAGFWKPEEFARSLLIGDKDRDGKLTKAESVGLIQPHFVRLDKNSDGFLDFDELTAVADWLNHYHQPGTPPATK